MDELACNVHHFKSISFNLFSEGQPDLVLSWEMPRTEIPDQVEGMDVPKREAPNIQLEAVVSRRCKYMPG